MSAEGAGAPLADSDFTEGAPYLGQKGGLPMAFRGHDSSRSIVAAFFCVQPFRADCTGSVQTCPNPDSLGNCIFSVSK